MTSGRDVVVLFDVDDTLLDNDHVIADLRSFLEQEVGLERAAEYFDDPREPAHRARLRRLPGRAAALQLAYRHDFTCSPCRRT